MPRARIWAPGAYRFRGPASTDVFQARFWAKVTKLPGDGCWVWTGTRVAPGYGKLRVDGRMQLTHRLAWAWLYGPIPAGLCICHHCDNPPCVRHDHLFLGTKADNMADASRKGRHWQQPKTHCPQGHPYAGENLYIYDKGGRQCRICAIARSLVRRARQRQPLTLIAQGA